MFLRTIVIQDIDSSYMMPLIFNFFTIHNIFSFHNNFPSYFWPITFLPGSIVLCSFENRLRLTFILIFYWWMSLKWKHKVRKSETETKEKQIQNHVFPVTIKTQILAQSEQIPPESQFKATVHWNSPISCLSLSSPYKLINFLHFWLCWPVLFDIILGEDGACLDTVSLAL
jgi:hypothetical protein